MPTKRLLECGCEVHDRDGEVPEPDPKIHADFEKVMLQNITHDLPTVAGRTLTWFYRHDDVRGVESLRQRKPEALRNLVRALRSEEREEWTDPKAVSAALVSLGLRPLD